MFSYTPQADGLLIEVSARRLDATLAERFTQGLEAFAKAQFLWISVDLQSVEFIDSSGISALLNLRNLLKTKERKIRLEHPQGAILSMLGLCQLEATFDITP